MNGDKTDDGVRVVYKLPVLSEEGQPVYQRQTVKRVLGF